MTPRRRLRLTPQYLGLLGLVALASMAAGWLISPGPAALTSAALGAAVAALLVRTAPTSRGRALVLGSDAPFLEQARDWATRDGFDVEAHLVTSESELARALGQYGAAGRVDVVAVEKSLCTPMRELVRFTASHPARLIVLTRAADRAATGPGVHDRALAASTRLAHPLSPAERGVKRLLDLAIAVTTLVVTTPFILAAMLAIRLESRGSALFRQTRLGIDGRRFTMLKLRTMRIDGDDSAHAAYVAALIQGDGDSHDGLYKLTRDPRVTRIGHLLRTFSLDELPQLVNVIVGDMSIVGPRPPLVHETELYDGYAWQRLRVKPGLTGLWQVSGRSRLTFREMIDLDIRYWQEWGFLKDLVILARSPLVILFSRSA